MRQAAAILIVLMAAAVLVEGCGGSKGNFRSRIPDCEDVSANARPGVDCINRPNNLGPVVTSSGAQKLTLTVDAGRRVSALLNAPPRVFACYVLAHGAGAGMTHPSMAAVAEELGLRGIATLRFQFPYMEQGSKRPDPPALCHATIRAAIAEAGRLLPKLPLIAGGRSFGGRMTSQAQAMAPLTAVRGLAFLGFPLHPAGRPADDRAEHLSDVKIPMLFLQGTRDALAELSLLRPVVERLGKRATLKLFAEADHSFHVPAKTGRKDAEVRGEILDALAAWTKSIVARA